MLQQMAVWTWMIVAQACTVVAYGGGFRFFTNNFLEDARRMRRRETTVWSVRGGASSDKETEDPNEELIKAALADTFVQAAPLIMAASCGDGSVALVAVHTQNLNEEEPLLYGKNNDCDDPSASVMDDDDDDQQTKLYNLPLDFGGPYRIQALDQDLVVLTTGWRADCDCLVRHAQQLVQTERAQLGSSTTGESGGSMEGRMLATQLSLFMAQEAGSTTSTRPLSCVALVASPSREEDDGAPQIWLTDATGAYPVRAMAVGRNARLVKARLCLMPTEQDNSNNEPPDAVAANSDDNAFETGKNGLRLLLSLLSENDVCGKGGARVELALLHPDRGMERMRLQDVATTPSKEEQMT